MGLNNDFQEDFRVFIVAILLGSIYCNSFVVVIVYAYEASG